MTTPTRRIVEQAVAEAVAGAPRAATGGRRVALGSDHAGYRMKCALTAYLREELDWAVLDCGTHSEDSVDYPDIAVAVARSVAEGSASRGIMIDGAGVGSTMVCNRVRGVLAAPAFDLFTVRNSREHNDANVLVLGSNVIPVGEARRLIRVWLATPFAGGRHERRVQKIHALDEARDSRPPRREESP